MKRFFWIFACLALASCVPLGAEQTNTATNLPPATQVDTVIEEVNLDELAGGQVEIVGGD